MIVKMSKRATPEEVAAVEEKLYGWGYKTGKMVGEEITLIGVYGDISRLPTGEIQEMGGVDSLIPISKAYKRVAQKGSPGALIHHTVRIGAVEVGGDELTIIAGPCSVESEAQIMEAARFVKEAGAKALRGGVVKYRSSPYSGWEGIGASSEEALRNGLKLIVKAGREFELPTVVEVLDPHDVSVYEDMGVDCMQVGEPNSKNQALLNRLRDTSLPVIHKRGNSLDIEAYLLWVERVMAGGKENVILCERGIVSPNKYTRNTLDIGGIAAFHYQLSCLPVAVDASHGTGIRDLVHPMTLAGIMAGASVVLVETHPNPLIAKSDGFQGLFPEQFARLVAACEQVWELRRRIEPLYTPSAMWEREYEGRVAVDKRRFFGAA
ncbi:MAG TPA: 3-deoxy-7-phosphoheptulonate synthase [Methylomirabilota bacterium]|jgi:3-deoxy-7-phosphoheptulonate synthase|nr:3-deoxy-7-phosphoheptulonate synthase [Methylomirabilota bacterium]